jgi:hypothetical protein
VEVCLLASTWHTACAHVLIVCGACEPVINKVMSSDCSSPAWHCHHMEAPCRSSPCQSDGARSVGRGRLSVEVGLTVSCIPAAGADGRFAACTLMRKADHQCGLTCRWCGGVGRDRHHGATTAHIAHVPCCHSDFGSSAVFWSTWESQAGTPVAFLGPGRPTHCDMRRLSSPLHLMDDM